MIWREILGFYRSGESAEVVVEKASKLFTQFISCQACSIFIFDEYGRCLNFFSGANRKNGISIPAFRSETSLWKMFDAKKPGKIDSIQIKGQYPRGDIFFENVSEVVSAAFSQILGERGNKIGVIRLLNKMNQQGKICNFSDSDLFALKTFTDIVGSLLTISSLQRKYEAFLDSVTHELLAPTSGIKNSAIFMKRIAFNPSMRKDPDLQDSFNSKIEDVLRFSEQAITLIQGLTMYTKSGRMTRTDLELKPSHLFKDVIEKCRGSLTPLLRARRFNHGSIRCIDRHFWPILKIDRKVFRQVFNNLLSNSIKYAHDDPEAFNVSIELEMRPNGDAEIIIEDYGIGLQKNEVSKLFDPTFRGHEARAKVPTGTGIGLTTVKNLLAAHECNIDVTGLQNPTQFTIMIPNQYVIGRGNDRFHRR